MLTRGHAPHSRRRHARVSRVNPPKTIGATMSGSTQRLNGRKERAQTHASDASKPDRHFHASSAYGYAMPAASATMRRTATAQSVAHLMKTKNPEDAASSGFFRMETDGQSGALRPDAVRHRAARNRFLNREDRRVTVHGLRSLDRIAPELHRRQRVPAHETKSQKGHVGVEHTQGRRSNKLRGEAQTVRPRTTFSIVVSCPTCRVACSAA